MLANVWPTCSKRWQMLPTIAQRAFENIAKRLQKNWAWSGTQERKSCNSQTCCNMNIYYQKSASIQPRKISQRSVTRATICKEKLLHVDLTYSPDCSCSKMQWFADVQQFAGRTFHELSFFVVCYNARAIPYLAKIFLDHLKRCHAHINVEPIQDRHGPSARWAPLGEITRAMAENQIVQEGWRSKWKVGPTRVSAVSHRNASRPCRRLSLQTRQETRPPNIPSALPSKK